MEDEDEDVHKIIESLRMQLRKAYSTINALEQEVALLNEEIRQLRSV